MKNILVYVSARTMQAALKQWKIHMYMQTDKQTKEAYIASILVRNKRE